MPDDLPLAVQNLIRNQIGSIAQLELLLRLHSRPDLAWTAAEAAKDLYAPVTMTEPLLEALHAAGLAVRSDDKEPRYRFAPRSDELRQSVDELAHLYQERRITIIGLIYSGPTRTLQDFADAFRIRKRED